MTLCKSVRSALQFFYIQYRRYFAIILNSAVYISSARVSMFHTLIPLLYVTFLVKKWKEPYQNTRLQFYHYCYPVYWTFKIRPSSIGFQWEKVLICKSPSSFCAKRLFQWDFFRQRVRCFAFHQCKFHFDSMYGGLDMPFDSNNMKIDKEGSLDV